MLPTNFRSALLLITVLRPRHVLGDCAVNFTFADCAYACIETAGYNTNSEDSQKAMCVAARDGLLETVEDCMLSSCSDGLSNVDSDLLTPMQTGCKDLEKPVSDEDVEAAGVVASSMLLIAVSYMSTATFTSTSTYTSTAAPSTTPAAAQTLTSSTEIQSLTPDAQPSILQVATTQAATTQAATTSAEESETTPAAPSSTEAETTAAVLSILEAAPATPTVESTAATTSSISVQSTSSLSTASLQTTLQTSVSLASTSVGATTTSRTSTATHTTLTVTPMAEAEDLSATTSGSDDDSLVMATGTPEAYTGTLFAFVTSTTASSSSSTKTSSSQATSGIGGGSPFSTTSAATTGPQIHGLAALSLVVVAISSLLVL